MEGFTPLFSPAQILTLLLLAAALVAEWFRRRRIRRFGDPFLLDSVPRRIRRGVALALLVVGFAAVAAMTDAEKSGAQDLREHGVAVVVDPALSAWSAETEALLVTLRQLAPQPYFAVYLAGPQAPLTAVVPWTSDVSAVSVLTMNAFSRTEPVEPVTWNTLGSLMQAEMRSLPVRVSRLLLLTHGRPPESSSSDSAEPASSIDPVWVRPAALRSAPDRAESWIWSDDVRSLAGALTESENAAGESHDDSSWTPTQALASLALILLGAEWLLSGIWWA